MRTYYIHDGQSEIGPFTIEELKLQNVSKATPVWHEGLASWTTVEFVPELSDLLRQPPKFHQITSTTTPPPLYDMTYGKEKSKKFYVIPIAITIGVIIISLISWLVYSNKKQAVAIESLKQEQQVQQQQQEIQQHEQKKVDFAVQKIEEEKQKQEEEKKRKIEDEKKKKKFYRNNWYEFISLEKNKYKYREIGGIFDLKVSITNNTAYVLDEVTVQIIYFKSNGDVWKTIEVPIYNIVANSFKVESIPDTERATRVEVQIMGIGSKGLQFCYAPGNWANNSEDPYYCK